MVLAILMYEQFIHHKMVRRCAHTYFEYPAACLSVIFKLPPGLIMFASFLCHDGLT